MAQKFLDNLTGLPTLWAKIKELFVAKESGKGLSSNDYTSDEKSKLAGITPGANKYSLPMASSSALGGIKVGSNLTIDSSGTLAAKDTTYGAASQTVAGLMSTADKKKLDGIASGANAFTKMSQLSNDTGFQTATQVQALINNAIVSSINYRGSVDSESLLPSSPKKGDMYNIVSASQYGNAGMNVIYDGSKWDAAGTGISIEAMNASEVNAICV